MFNNPYIYASGVPSWAEKYSKFVKAAKGRHVKKAPFFSVFNFQSVSGQASFTSFAKFNKFGKDLYADLVAPSLKTNLLVETWPNGRGKRYNFKLIRWFEF